MLMRDERAVFLRGVGAGVAASLLLLAAGAWLGGGTAPANAQQAQPDARPMRGGESVPITARTGLKPHELFLKARPGEAFSVWVTLSSPAGPGPGVYEITYLNGSDAKLENPPKVLNVPEGNPSGEIKLKLKPDAKGAVELEVSHSGPGGKTTVGYRIEAEGIARN